MYLWSILAGVILVVVVKPSASLVLQLGAIDATGLGAIDDPSCFSTCQALSLSALGDGDFALGEPHLENIHGERFDALQKGTSTLLVYPPDKNHKAKLHVQASIESEGPVNESQCDSNFFIRQLWIKGSIVGEEIQILTSGRDPWDPSILEIKVGSITMQNSTDIDLFFSKKKFKVVFSDKRDDNQKRHLHNRITFASLVFDLDGAEVEIKWNTGKRLPNRIGFHASHLVKVGKNWGGILGADDHTWIASYDPQCQKKTDLGHRVDFHKIRDPEPLWASASLT